MKLYIRHAAIVGPTVSKSNHKNVAVWSTRSTLVSGRLVK